MKRRTCLFVVLLLMIAAVGSFWLMTADPVAGAKPVVLAPVEEPLISLSQRDGAAAPSDLLDKVASVRIPEQWPASLSGTSVPDGWARTDRLGNLIPSPHLRQLFEYFLSALGEESLQQLVARIKTALSALEEPARSQALATLGNYLDYKLAVSELEQSYTEVAVLGAGEMRRRMAEIQALRRTWLDADTVEAFFADDEAVDRFQIEKLRITSDDSLTDEQKAEALRQAESSLPESIRKAREETRRFADYEQARRELADDREALAAWRQAAFGEAAADRLARLEVEQKDWDRRWQDYARERDELLSSGLAEPERREALKRLRASHFNDTERIRARALDSIR